MGQAGFSRKFIIMHKCHEFLHKRSTRLGTWGAGSLALFAAMARQG